MTKITLSAYAKINLSLFITGTRDDGYHCLESVMQEISLADTLEMEKIPSGILLSCNKEHIPTGEKNLCWKAANAYLTRAGINGGVKIRLTKRIPDGAGMGGGSADAAAVLKGMMALYPSDVDLFDVGARIGADVPFCLAGGTCLCEGIGEKLTPLSFPKKKNLFAVVAKNCEGLSTPYIYSLYDKLQAEEKKPAAGSAFCQALTAGELEKAFRLMHNDLEICAIAERPAIGELKSRFIALGADASMMTGSGSAVFGLFLSEEKARSCEKAIKKDGIEAYFCTLF